MPGWLTGVLKWGGIALTILMATALVYLEIFPRTSEDEASAAPVMRYWVMLVVGLAAAVIGVVVDRRKAG